MNGNAKSQAGCARIAALLMLAAFTLLVACAPMQDHNIALEETRAYFDGAAAAPQVATLADKELQRARTALLLAEKAWADGGISRDVEHLAYLARQRVTIAREIAATRAARAAIIAAGVERDLARKALLADGVSAARQPLTDTQQISSDEPGELERELLGMNAKVTARGLVVTLDDRVFNPGKSVLLPAAKRRIAQLARTIRSHPQRRVSVEGHTDASGTARANLVLSQRRADAVAAALIKQGVSAERISTRGFGATQPLAASRAARNQRQDRRVEVVFLGSAALGGAP